MHTSLFPLFLYFPRLLLLLALTEGEKVSRLCGLSPGVMSFSPDMLLLLLLLYLMLLLLY
jgi:hypothetical protein